MWSTRSDTYTVVGIASIHYNALQLPFPQRIIAIRTIKEYIFERWRICDTQAFRLYHPIKMLRECKLTSVNTNQTLFIEIKLFHL